MKKKIGLLVAVAGVFAAFGSPSASYAACNDGTSQERDELGQPTGADTLQTLPDGGVVYGDGAEENLNPGYLGVVGPRGYVEASGNLDDAPNVQVDGSSADAPLEGRAGVDTGSQSADACVNDTEIL